jgi:hypothetical protein
LFHCESQDQIPSSFSPLSKFYINGKLVTNTDDSSENANTMESDEPNLLSYLKFGFGSESDQDSSSEDITFDLKESNQDLKSDEEMAAEPL